MKTKKEKIKDNFFTKSIRLDWSVTDEQIEIMKQYLHLLIDSLVYESLKPKEQSMIMQEIKMVEKWVTNQIFYKLGKINNSEF